MTDTTFQHQSFFMQHFTKTIIAIMPCLQLFLLSLLAFCLPLFSFAQHAASHVMPAENVVQGVEPQPLLAQAIRLKQALSFLGSALSNEDALQLKELQDKAFTEKTSRRIQAILDPYCLALVDI